MVAKMRYVSGLYYAVKAKTAISWYCGGIKAVNYSFYVATPQRTFNIFALSQFHWASVRII